MYSMWCYFSANDLTKMLGAHPDGLDRNSLHTGSVVHSTVFCPFS